MPPKTFTDQPPIDLPHEYMASLLADIREAGYAIVSYAPNIEEDIYATAFTAGRDPELIVFGMPPEVGSSLLRDICEGDPEDICHGSEIDDMVAFGDDNPESVALRAIAPVSLMGYAPILASIRNIANLPPSPKAALHVVTRNETGLWELGMTEWQPKLMPL